MLDTDSILAIATSVGVASCCIVVLVSSICYCNPRNDCRRCCADCKKHRENCRKCCARGCPRERADTEEELI